MRMLARINFPNANTLQELEEDLSIKCTNSTSEHRLSWSRGTFHLRQHRMELEALQENNTNSQKREEMDRLKEGEKAYWDILPSLIQEGYTSLDMLQRVQTSNHLMIVQFRVPPTKGVNPTRRLILQDWFNERSIKQWSELKMGSVKVTTVRVVDTFASVTEPSLPVITDLQLTLKHLLKLSREQAQVWWKKFLEVPNPTIRTEIEHCRGEILTVIEKGWELESWQDEIERAHQKLGPLVHPHVSGKRK